MGEIDRKEERRLEEAENILEQLKEVSEENDIEEVAQEWLLHDILELFRKDKNMFNNIGTSEDPLAKDLFGELSKSLFEGERLFLYLKLLYIYDKYSKLHGDDQELYYVIARVRPNDRELHDMIRKVKEFYRSSGLANFVSKNFDFDEAIIPYKMARDMAQQQIVSKNKKTTEETKKVEADTLQEIVNALSEAIRIYGNKETILEIIESNENESYEEVVDSLNVINLANMYCKVVGLKLTDMDIETLRQELSREELELLSNRIKGIK